MLKKVYAAIQVAVTDAAIPAATNHLAAAAVGALAGVGLEKIFNAF
jgi:hypothetical protein